MENDNNKTDYLFLLFCALPFLIASLKHNVMFALGWTVIPSLLIAGAFRSGHVNIISNISYFGDGVYKIGMTRRLEPMDRVTELGDASVPFRFDVHAIIYCEDAPKLENKLHKKFHNVRINQVNFRKEFFRVSLDEIATAVHEFHGEIEFTKLAEAIEFRKTVAFLQQGQSNLLPEFTPQNRYENSILEV